MKKTDKVNPLIAFRKANEARQAEVKKSIKKYQDGGTPTPFQSYMKTKGAKASDTTATDQIAAKAKVKDKPILNKAYELTYGQDFKNREVGMKKEYTPEGRIKLNGKFPIDNTRGMHSGYSDKTNAYRKEFESDVAKNKKTAKSSAVKRKK